MNYRLDLNKIIKDEYVYKFAHYQKNIDIRILYKACYRYVQKILEYIVDNYTVSNIQSTSRHLFKKCQDLKWEYDHSQVTYSYLRKNRKTGKYEYYDVKRCCYYKGKRYNCLVDQEVYDLSDPRRKQQNKDRRRDTWKDLINSVLLDHEVSWNIKMSKKNRLKKGVYNMTSLGSWHSSDYLPPIELRRLSTEKTANNELSEFQMRYKCSIKKHLVGVDNEKIHEDIVDQCHRSGKRHLRGERLCHVLDNKCIPIDCKFQESTDCRKDTRCEYHQVNKQCVSRK